MDVGFDLSCIMVIFGGTGDLAHRKLLPAIYNLKHEKMLPEDSAIVAIGRQSKTNDGYREEIYNSIKQFSRFDIDIEVWNSLKDRIYYRKMDFLKAETYQELNEYLNEIDEKHKAKGKRMYYMAVAPEYFEPIAENISSFCMIEETDSWSRVVIEKPFGRDLTSAKYLNDKIVSVFKEENVYRIDHYLGKEMLQNIMVIRFANMLFEPLWNNKYIDHIQMSSSETVGVENRGGYYEKAGAMRDMVQSHMLQLLSLIAMEPPNDLEAKSIRDEKVKVLRALRKIEPEAIKGNVIRGQYGPKGSGDERILSYREEKKVSPDSNTETFVALKVDVENLRWSGVPFYIRTGKRMKKKSTEIIVQFKPMHNILYFEEKEVLPNMLVIKIQPTEGIFLQFNAKEPGSHRNIIPVQMDFCQNCQVGINSPEAYERLLFDVLRGDATLFTRWDEVEYAWKFVDQTLGLWDDTDTVLSNYEPGSWGPKESDMLLEKDNRNWINP
ncbi:glucose-6-phosphate dehydrogenase [Wukongibacter baidiensis]|uniref:glucose-6-phosphate dehydrogenase n=1 Tax=Wukongibacter baidiensis TaxID=1723361 RepID=UPI003D7F62C5